MLFFHSFWTRPRFENTDHAAEGEIELWEFEWLTWLVSALEARSRGELRLITDTRGRQFIQRTGLEWIYNGGISTALDQLPAEIDPKLFWTAGKIVAWFGIDEPAWSIDTDAILWQEVRPASPVIGLHVEDRQWDWYRANRERFGPFGFDDGAWNWELDPLNTGVVYIESVEVMRFYAETSLRFMVEYSRRFADPAVSLGRKNHEVSDALLFADQRLVPMCADRLGQAATPLCRLDPSCGHLVRDPVCLHLWDSKVLYKYCVEARVAYVNHLAAHVLERYPEARDTLARWNLDRPLPVDPRMQLDLRDFKDSDPRKRRFGLLAEVEGVVSIVDSNVNARRKAVRDSFVLPGETVTAEPGAHYRIVPAAASGARTGG